MVAKVEIMRASLTEEQEVVRDCLDLAKKEQYDFVFVYGMKGDEEYLHHSGFDTLEMIGRLEGLKFQIWLDSQK